MDIVTFDALRSLHFPDVHYIKPEQMLANLDRIRAADGVIFPQYWQINALVYALNKRIFPSISTYMIGHDKVEMTRCFEVVAPQNVPFTLILAHSQSNAEYAWETMATPFVAKIPLSSMGDGVFLIDSPGEWRAYLERTEVIYVQEYLPIDRDLRIVWVGREIVGGYWRAQLPGGFHNNVAKGGVVEPGPVPEPAARLVEQLATALGIDHGGFDVAMAGDHPYVFEFNRIFGNQGLAGDRDRIDNAIMAYLGSLWSDQPRAPG